MSKKEPTIIDNQLTELLIANKIDDERWFLNKIINQEIIKKVFSKLPLAAIIVVSIIIRFITAAESQGFVHPDEVFQTIEMIHYRIFGKYGTGQTIPWEYNLNYENGGARSWFFVLVLALVYRFVMLFGVEDPVYLIFSARLVLSLTSMITVLVAYFFGKEAFNEKVGLLSAFLCGTWWFFPFWASRTMTDSPASDMLFLSTFLIYKATKNKDRNITKGFTLAIFSGIFIGIAFMIRFPSALLGIPLAIWPTTIGVQEFIIYARNKNKSDMDTRKEQLRKILKPFLVLAALCLGALLMIIIQGLLDLATWGVFLHSPINFFIYNIVKKGSAHHGVAKWYAYFTGFYNDFAGVFLILFILIFVIGLDFSRKKVTTTSMILVIMVYWLVTFSSIAHKEFRFIMIILPLGMIYIANGIYKLSLAFRKKSLQYTVIGAMVIAFCSASLIIGIGEKNWMWKWNSGICNAMYWVGQQDDVETLIVFEMVWYTGGYAYLHKNITCLFFRIYPGNPSGSFNSSYCRWLYQQNGTYIIVRIWELLLVIDTLESFGMTILVEVFGNPNAYVFAKV